MSATPSGCAHCGIQQRDRSQRWTREAGWHGYIPPSQELIKARMITRRKETRS